MLISHKMYTLKSTLECLESFVSDDLKIICCIPYAPKAYLDYRLETSVTKVFVFLILSVSVSLLAFGLYLESLYSCPFSWMKSYSISS